MKILSVLLLMGLSLLYFLTGSREVWASQTYHTGELLLSDNFEDGNYNGWVVENGNWLVHDSGLGYGKNLYASKCAARVSGKVSQGSNWDNYSIVLDVNNVAGVDEMVDFRRNGEDSFYEVNLKHYYGYYNPTPQINLYKTQGGVRTTLATHNLSALKHYQWYHLKIEVFQEHIQVWLDSNLAFEIDDPGTTVKTGNISLAYWTGDYGCSLVRFDNVQVNSLSKYLNPVIFIPGIGGSEFQISQDTSWSKDNGHGGNFSHKYSGGEKVWVNETEAAMPGEDDYFDILKLKEDGQTSEAPLVLTGNLTPFGYSDIDSFFQELGYTKGVNFFVFPYDWRRDIRLTKDSLDSLVEEAKTKSGMGKVNIVAHSMGGLVGRYYISDSARASKVGKLIELGVPHLGSVDALKAIMYGKWLSYSVPFLPVISLGIVPDTEIKDLFSNLTSGFELLPTAKYFDFYDGSSQLNPAPFYDQRDVDNNQVKGFLSYSETKVLMNNLRYNMNIFNIAEQFHNLSDSSLDQSNKVKIYEIIGSNQPTLGQIQETYLIRWPIQLFDRKEEIFINGDGTVPLYSASLKNDSVDISGGAKIYYVDQKHGDLVTKNTPSMITVKNILSDDEALPVEVKSEKITLEGKQISVDQDADLDMYDDQGNHTGPTSDGNIETKIPGTFYDTLGTSKHTFVKKNAPKVKVKIRPSQNQISKTKLTLRHYQGDQVVKTAVYPDLLIDPSTPSEVTIDPTSLTSPAIPSGGQMLSPTEATGSAALDFTPPTVTISLSGNQTSGNNYISSVTINLTTTDSGSGVSKVEYSLDNGQTIQAYSQPFTINVAGTYTLQIIATDNLGNQSLPQTITFTIVSSPISTPTPTTILTSTPTPASSSPDSSVNNSSTSNNTDNNSSSGSINSPIGNSSKNVGDQIAEEIFKSLTKVGQVLGTNTGNIPGETNKFSPPESVKNYQSEKNFPLSNIFSQPLYAILIPALVIGSLPFVTVSLQSLFLRSGLGKPTPKKMNNPKPKK